MTRGERPMNQRGVRVQHTKLLKNQHPNVYGLCGRTSGCWLSRRRGILSLGLLLIVINKACSLVLPLSTKVLFDRSHSPP